MQYFNSLFSFSSEHDVIIVHTAAAGDVFKSTQSLGLLLVLIRKHIDIDELVRKLNLLETLLRNACVFHELNGVRKLFNILL